MARQKLVHLHTSENRAPVASDLNFGEIAVMHNEEAQALYIKAGNSGSQTNAVVKFITEDAVKSLISGATNDFVALKTEVKSLSAQTEGAVGAVVSDLGTLSGSVETLGGKVLTGAVVNNVTGTVENNVVSVEVDTDDIKVGTAITYSGETLISTTATTSDALQALSTKIQSIDGVVSESNHGHTNKAVLDGITSEKVSAWDQAATDDHTHENAAVLDALTAEEVAAWNASAHTHENAAVLDALTAEEVAKWNASAHTHENASVLNGITSEKVTAWDSAATNNHVHSNASVLDGITAEKVSTWDALSTGASVAVSARTTGVTEGMLKAYDVYQGGTLIGTIDIPKDLVVTSGGVETVNDAKVLRLFIANQAAPVDIAVSDLAHVYTEGNGIEISTGDVVSVKVVEANGLSVGANGVAMALASASANGAMSSSDFEKLATIAASAQVNTLESVKVNGTALSADAKSVNITVEEGTADGTIAVNGSNVAVHGLGSAAYVATTAFDAAGTAASEAEAASGAAVTAVVGTMSGDTKTLGALQAAIASVEASVGDSNVIEGVQVNGADLTPDANKKVNVTVTSGSANGTIAVNGSDVAVTGLGSAAYAATTDFDAAGAAGAASAAAYTSAVTAVVGTAQDDSGATTIKGVKLYAYEIAQSAVANAVTGATGDTYVEATVVDKVVTISTTSAFTNAVTAANGSVQGIQSGKENGVTMDANNKLDFTGINIDCGEY